jgi:hypothetical protein
MKPFNKLHMFNTDKQIREKLFENHEGYEDFSSFSLVDSSKYSPSNVLKGW